MSPWLSGYMLALGGFVFLWLGVSGYVIVTRALFDVADFSFNTGRRVLERRLARLGSGEAALKGLPCRTLAGIAADASTAPALGRLAARRLLGRRGDRVIRQAGGHRTDVQKWRRIAALRILSIAGHSSAMPLLRVALEDADLDVATAAVSILGMGADSENADLLVDALRRNAVSRSRIAAQLDTFSTPILDTLKPLLDDLDPAVRQWGATLIARYDDPIVSLELAALVSDDDPRVRAAALKGLVAGGSPFGAQAALNALEDPIWFVRAHAARALGRIQKPELAADVVSLLGDPYWWVRAAAKDALQEMGGPATPAIVQGLRSNDEFARNGAAEVLQNTGVIDKLVTRLAAVPGDELAAASVESVFAAGGPAFSVAAERRGNSRLAALALARASHTSAAVGTG
ncbi:MAG TPA: HEAT repeat domain-containing protein [Gaiellaceae bacterium]|nr:HEAT repeat domain-containing protein [Gaiellaceae bacterium]